jgi:hypothetical protein
MHFKTCDICAVFKAIHFEYKGAKRQNMEMYSMKIVYLNSDYIIRKNGFYVKEVAKKKKSIC